MNHGLTSSPVPDSQGEPHSIIAYACGASEPLIQGLNTLNLPHLAALLGKMTCVSQGSTATDLVAGKFPESAYLMAHESVLNLWNHQPQWGKEVIITPCHWQVGMNDVVMRNPADIQLTGEESQALLLAIQPYFAEDGIEVTYESPLVWRAKGSMFQDLPLAAIDKAVGQHVNAWMPSAPQARPLQRLQSEMQMLLYQHPVNDQRSLQGRWTVNSFWVHRPLAQLFPDTNPAKIHMDLKGATEMSDAALWRQQWESLDNTVCKNLWNALAQQQAISLTLCSDTAWRHYRPQKKSLWNSLQNMFKPLSVQKELSALLEVASTL
jgi:hypothetical protein